MKSALVPAPFRAGSAVPLSIGLHVALFGLLASASQCESEASSLIDPNDVMEVAMVALPKAEKLHRVTRAPDPPAGNTREAKAPPPPPVESDMALQVEEAPKERGRPAPTPEVKPERREEDVSREARRQALMESLRNAPVGKKDNPLADPNGIEGAAGSSRGAMGDPVIAAWAESVRAAIRGNFSVLQTEPLMAIFQLLINRQGRIVRQQMTQSSGNPSFDAAARTAIRNTGNLPAPPEAAMPGETAQISITLSNTE